MNKQLPNEWQPILVKLDNREWQPAIYRHGEFVDIYGLPLDGEKISSWRPAGESTNGNE